MSDLKTIKPEYYDAFINTIKSCIKSRTEKNELHNCEFAITTPLYQSMRGLEENPIIAKIETFLSEHDMYYGYCDTVSGAYNLNRDWLITKPMKCAVEYNGVYPIDWDLNFLAEFIDAEAAGDIMVVVTWLDDSGEFLAMNH